MRKHLTRAALCLCLGLPATAQDMILPSQPGIRDFEFPRGSIGFYTTSVLRYTDGHTEAYYGFIYGNMKRDAVVYVVNDVLGIRCKGETKRLKDRSGAGFLECQRNGKPYSRSDIQIAAGVYGKMKGTDTGTVQSPGGKDIATFITRWHAFSFPDAVALAQELGQ